MMALCEPKHVGAVFIILKIILQFVCISWKIKCLILLMHGATMKSKQRSFGYREAGGGGGGTCQKSTITFFFSRS